MSTKYLIEFLGTTFLMFVILATGNWAAIGAISGGAFNPAVALALYSAGKLPKADLIPYIIVEILGALAALYLYQNYVIKG
jgi:aquaporin Z